jgi:hypothetical protein
MQKRSILLLFIVYFFAGSALKAMPYRDAALLDECKPEVAMLLGRFVGEWSLHIEADEGWTGSGHASIAVDKLHVCSLFETSNAVFNQESDNPVPTNTKTFLIWDNLSESLKVMSSDNRGYVHLGQSRDVDSDILNFDILRMDQTAPTRRIVYRDLSADQFTWVWQGSVDKNTDWQDRLTIKYTRK